MYVGLRYMDFVNFTTYFDQRLNPLFWSVILKIVKEI